MPRVQPPTAVSITPDERAAVVKLLRETIAADNYPLSLRIQLDSAPSAAAEPYPPAKAWVTAASGSGKRRR